MTSEEYRGAMQFVSHVLQILGDPVAMARLKTLQAEVNGTVEWAEKLQPVEGYERTPNRGTCPTCGKKCAINNDESLRRHRGDTPKCELDKQLPAEIVPAVLLIAGLSDKNERGSNGTQLPDTHNI